MSTSPTYGLGYSGSGFASQQERTYSSSPTPYDPAVLSYANRRAERRAYMQQYLDWLEAYQLPLYIGEYGILNPCAGGDAAFSAQYAADTYEVYSNLYVISGSQSIPIKMPRTWWTHGYWDGLALWYRSGTCNGTGPKEYFPYAMELTGELNLVANAGFEDDFAGWTTTGTIQVADVVANPANVRSGARSALSWSASAYSATLQSASATNTPAGTYTARVWSRAGGTFGTRELQVYINGSLAHQLTMPVTTTWTAYTISGITVPAGATIRLGISLNASGGAWTQFDDFEFRKN